MTSAAIADEDDLILLPFSDVAEVLDAPDWRAVIAGTAGTRVPLGDPRLVWHPPVRPAKTICVGLNYRTHIAETGRDTPTRPTLFAKFPDTLTGPFAPIRLPEVSEKVDWEVELGVVVGRSVKHADLVSAQAAIAGYTVVNDVSMRDWQNRTTQWMAGKNFEATTPVGPWVVTTDEIDASDGLAIVCTVDGESVQRSVTSDLLFGPAELVAYVSQFTTLHPGDLIATGTPGGVGAARSPQRFLAAGQTLVSEIEAIGKLTNLVT